MMFIIIYCPSFPHFKQKQAQPLTKASNKIQFIMRLRQKLRYFLAGKNYFKKLKKLKSYLGGSQQKRYP